MRNPACLFLALACLAVGTARAAEKCKPFEIGELWRYGYMRPLAFGKHGLANS